MRCRLDEGINPPFMRAHLCPNTGTDDGKNQIKKTLIIFLCRFLNVIRDFGEEEGNNAKNLCEVVVLETQRREAEEARGKK